MKSSTTSTKACTLPGTAVLALLTIHRMKARPSAPSTTAVTTESTLIDQKPAPSAGCVRKLRWCPMYSLADLYSVAIGRLLVVFAHEKSHRKNYRRRHERSEERGNDDAPVNRQDKPEQDDDESDLDDFGSQRGEQDLPCRPPLTQRGNDAGRPAGDD